MRRRYTARANPQLAGDSVLVSFRCPRVVVENVRAKIGRPGIETFTDAGQDALVVWAMLEEAEEASENGESRDD